MGHIRLGRLPRRWRWPQIFEAVGSQEPSVAGIVGGISNAASRDLGSLREKPDVVGFRIWLISALGEAAQSPKFADRLGQLGIPPTAADSPLSLVAAITQVGPPKRFPLEHSVFDAIAISSLREALTNHLAMRTESLFETRAETLRAHCAELADPRVFASVTRRFLSGFSGRLIRYITDREISNSISRDGPVRDLADVEDFGERLDAYCFDSSRIVEDFAESWFAKSRYQAGEPISPASATRFAALALRKLQMEFEGLDRAS